MKSGYPVTAKHVELERRSAHQLRLKAVEMLRSSTQLVKSHGDDLRLEYGSLEYSLKAVEKNAEYAGQPEILVLVHVIERPITVHYMTAGADLDRFIRFAQTCQIFSQKNFS